MRAADHDTMYADTFISYLPRDLIIDLTTLGPTNYPVGTETLLERGNKFKILDYLESCEKRYVLCDTSCVYLEGDICTIYVE